MGDLTEGVGGVHAFVAVAGDHDEAVARDRNHQRGVRVGGCSDHDPVDAIPTPFGSPSDCPAASSVTAAAGRWQPTGEAHPLPSGLRRGAQRGCDSCAPARDETGSRARLHTGRLPTQTPLVERIDNF